MAGKPLRQLKSIREIEAKALEVAKQMEALRPAMYAESKRRNDGTIWTDAVTAAWEATVKISDLAYTVAEKAADDSDGPYDEYCRERTGSKSD